MEALEPRVLFSTATAPAVRFRTLTGVQDGHLVRSTPMVTVASTVAMAFNGANVTTTPVPSSGTSTTTSTQPTNATSTGLTSDGPAYGHGNYSADETQQDYYYYGDPFLNSLTVSADSARRHIGYG